MSLEETGEPSSSPTSVLCGAFECYWNPQHPMNTLLLLPPLHGCNIKRNKKENIPLYPWYSDPIGYFMTTTQPAENTPRVDFLSRLASPDNDVWTVCMCLLKGSRTRGYEGGSGGGTANTGRMVSSLFIHSFIYECSQPCRCHVWHVLRHVAISTAVTQRQ